MPLTIHESNRLENLIDPLIDQIKQHTENPMAPHHIVVNSLGIQQWLIKKICKKNGILFHRKILSPQQLLTEITEQLLPQSDTYFSQDCLILRIYQILKTTSAEKLALSELLNEWLYPADESLKKKRLMDTAFSLGTLFHDYQWERTNWLNAWENHRNVNLPNDDRLEAFQSALWRQLINASDQKTQLTRHSLINQIIQHLSGSKSNPPAHLFPNGLNVFSVIPLPPPIWSVLCALSEHYSVNLYWINPSQELWSEQLYSPATEDKWYANADPSFDDSLLFHQHHPLLMYLGLPSAALHQQIINDEQQETISHFEQNSAAELSLLQQIQQHILNDQTKGTLHQNAHDNSIQIYRCQAAREELECLRQCIGDWLTNTPNAVPSDIIVLTTDLDLYLPWFSNIFADIDHTAPATYSPKSSLIACFDTFLTLLSSDCEFVSLRDFFDFAPVIEKLNIPPNILQNILAYYHHAGFYWGITDAQRQQSGFPTSSSLESLQPWIWDKLLKQTHPQPTPWEEMTVFQQYIDQLISAHKQSQQSLTITQWTTYFRTWIQTFFGWSYKENAPETEISILAQAIKKLNQNAKQADFSEPLPLSSMIKLWQRAIKPNQKAPYYLDNKLAFSNLLTMHAVPAKFIAVLGLNRSLIKQAPSNQLDLRKLRPAPHDRSFEKESDHHFLETLLSARDTLWLSYGKTVRDSADKPAPLLTNFLEYIQEHCPTFPKQPLTYVSTPIAARIPLHKAPSEPELQTADYSPALYLTAEQLAIALIDPIKTHLKHQGIVIPRVPPTPNPYQSNELSYADQNRFLTEIMRHNLLKQEHKTEQLIDSIAKERGWLLPSNVMETLSQTAQTIKMALDQTPQLDNLELETDNDCTFWHSSDQIFHSQSELISDQIQLFSSGIGADEMRLLIAWLSHLIVNSQRPITTYYLYCEKNRESLKPTVLQLAPTEPTIAEQYLCQIANLYQNIHRTIVVAPKNFSLGLAKNLDENRLIEQYHRDLNSPWIALSNLNLPYLPDPDTQTIAQKYAQTLWQDCFKTYCHITLKP